MIINATLMQFNINPAGIICCPDCDIQMYSYDVRCHLNYVQGYSGAAQIHHNNVQCHLNDDQSYSEDVQGHLNDLECHP